jgi:hypothetical protein
LVVHLAQIIANTLSPTAKIKTRSSQCQVCQSQMMRYLEQMYQQSRKKPVSIPLSLMRVLGLLMGSRKAQINGVSSCFLFHISIHISSQRWLARCPSKVSSHPRHTVRNTSPTNSSQCYWAFAKPKVQTSASPLQCRG